MKLLSIGNSFSQDAHRWLAPVAASMGGDIEAYNLYIGGCSLERHHRNAQTGEAVYELEYNGNFQRWISLTEALEIAPWDVVTLQQASPYSGEKESYLPYLPELCDLVRQRCPGAEIMLHRTWAYEADCAWESFERYHRSTEEMERRVAAGYAWAAQRMGLRLIPTGEVIRTLRQENTLGREPLTRDGAHLSHIYGRYAAALTWAGVLTGKDVRTADFIPAFEGYDGEPALLAAIGETVYKTLKK